MQDHREFKNPPIKEAIIDIQVSAPKLNVEHLKLVEEMEGKGFSDCKPIFSQEFKFKSENGKLVSDGDLERALLGFRFDDEDEGYVAQFRLNGFTFSKIGDYKGWDEFREKAIEAWASYRNVVGDPKFTRLAVRFINILVLPKGEGGNVDLDQYLVNSPKVPNGLPDILTNFFSKVDVRVDDPGCIAVVTQAPAQEPQSSANVPVALDIDVYRSKLGEYTEREAWEFLEKLRGIKNRAFLGSITEKTMELIDQ